MEAPKPTTTNYLKTFEYSNEQNGKKYNWKFLTTSDYIEMNINEITIEFNIEIDYFLY